MERGLRYLQSVLIWKSHLITKRISFHIATVSRQTKMFNFVTSLRDKVVKHNNSVLFKCLSLLKPLRECTEIVSLLSTQFDSTINCKILCTAHYIVILQKSSSFDSELFLFYCIYIIIITLLRKYVHLISNTCAFAI